MPPPAKPPAAGNRSARLCPNCKATVPPGSTRCPGCQLEVAKMAGFQAAMRAAQQRGLGKTLIEKEKRNAPPVSIERGEEKVPSKLPKLIALAVLVLGIAGTIYYFTRPAPPLWVALPNTRDSLVKDFLSHINTDQDSEFKKAYAEIAIEARDSTDSDELGHYIGLFHAMQMYFRDQIDPGWAALAVLSSDPKDENLIVAKIGLETLHIRVIQDTPPDKLAAAHEHYAIMSVDEFNIADAQGFQGHAGVMGAVGGLAGQGAVNNLNTVIGAMGRIKQTHMQMKFALLPIIRDPHQVSRNAIIRLWPLRKDPVVIDKLHQIAQDGRYDADIQKTAENVIAEKISEEELIAVGVAD